MKYVFVVAGVSLISLLAAGAGTAGAWQMDSRGHMGMSGRMHGMMMHPRASVPANAPAALGRFGCTSCHSQHEGGVGPAFTWVAWRYRDRPQSTASLAAFIEHGGHGYWPGAMPDFNVPAADATAIAGWILSLPPEAPPRGGE